MVHRKHHDWARTLLLVLAALLLATTHADALAVGCKVCKEDMAVEEIDGSVWE